MTEETIAAPTPVVAPVAAPSPAPVAAPATTSQVDPGKFPIREDYAAGAAHREACGDRSSRTSGSCSCSSEEIAIPSPESVSEEPALKVIEEEDFQLEPETIVTPELLSQMVTDNPEFGKLLESDARLKGQLYKTAREAAELKPYRAIFPDIESAKTAQDYSATWIDVRETFLGSTTRDGTMASLGKIAELSWERDGDGNVVMQNGKPVIGDDFFGFVTTWWLSISSTAPKDVSARLKANVYRSEDERNRDQRVNDALQLLREESAATSPALEAQPDALRRKAEELDRRETRTECSPTWGAGGRETFVRTGIADRSPDTYP